MNNRRALYSTSESIITVQLRSNLVCGSLSAVAQQLSPYALVSDVEVNKEPEDIRESEYCQSSL